MNTTVPQTPQRQEERLSERTRPKEKLSEDDKITEPLAVTQKVVNLNDEAPGCGRK